MIFKLHAFRSVAATADCRAILAAHGSDFAHLTAGYSVEDRTGPVAKPDAATTETSIITSALLLDLSGNKEAAFAWANAQLPGLDIRPISKADLKWGSKRDALQRVRRLAPHTFAIFTADLDMQSARGALMMFAALAGSGRVLIGRAHV